MSENTNNAEQTQTHGNADAAAAPSKKGWINGRTAAYTVAGAVAVIGIGAAAWALLRNPKAAEAVVDAAA